MNQESYPHVPTRAQKVRLVSVMSASAAARKFISDPLAEAVFRQTEAGKEAAPQYGSNVRVRSVANILRQSGSPSPSFPWARASVMEADRLLYSTDFPLQAAKRSHAARLSDRGLERKYGYRFVDWMRMFWV